MPTSVIAGRGKGSGLAATASNLLYQRTGVTGPLVIFSVVLRFPSCRSLVLALPY